MLYVEENVDVVCASRVCINGIRKASGMVEGIHKASSMGLWDP
jgi:hypothetical protein